MKSVLEMTWKMKSIPERLILKKKQDYNISYLLSQTFLNKNYTDEEIYTSLGNENLYDLTYQNEDFELASKYFLECSKENKKILIFGDYDVDGYCSTYLLYDFITNLNIKCDYYIPNRFKDGYGPNLKLLKKLIDKNKYSLILFVDCGSNSIDEINYLETKNLKTIIIDHHQIYKKKKLIKTVIINPLKNFNKNYSSNFCATTLVYFFLKYLNDKLIKEKKINFTKYLFFSAIATICDQMPLRDLNKRIVKKGLNNFNFYNFKKILNLNNKILSSDIAFNLGPILNSPSRLGDSNLTIKFLTEENEKKIIIISDKLISINEKRKKIQKETFNLIKQSTEIIKDEVIFKYEKNINEGFLGIIAANFVEKYNKPCFILTNSNNKLKCSSRSIYGFDIGKIFNEALLKKIIEKGGGHARAGGCTLDLSKLFEFKKFLNDIYKKKFSKFENAKYYTSEQNFDSLKSFFKNDLQKLEPLGNDNQSPLFLLKKNKIIKTKIINDHHLQILINNNNKTCLCFAFNSVGTKIGEILMNYKNHVDLIVQINNKINKKNSDFKLIIKDIIV